jgi:hypothetical protein
MARTTKGLPAMVSTLPSASRVPNRRSASLRLSTRASGRASAASASPDIARTPKKAR